MIKSKLAELYAVASRSQEKKNTCMAKLYCDRIYESYEEFLWDKKI